MFTYRFHVAVHIFCVCVVYLIQFFLYHTVHRSLLPPNIIILLPKPLFYIYLKISAPPHFPHSPHLRSPAKPEPCPGTCPSPVGVNLTVLPDEYRTCSRFWSHSPDGGDRRPPRLPGSASYASCRPKKYLLRNASERPENETQKAHVLLA